MVDMEIFLTTANNLEGYAVVKQLGVVFGETVFKHSVGSQFGASLADIGLGTRELSGSVSLIEKARSFAYDKMIKAAKARGANAIIAIDSDNTFGGEVMYISLYGTAVKVVPASEKEEIDRQEIEQREKERAEKKKIENERESFIAQLREALKNGGDHPVVSFISEVSEDTSMIDVWKKWNEYSFDSLFPEINEYVVAMKDNERYYGRANSVRHRDELIRKLREL